MGKEVKKLTTKAVEAIIARAEAGMHPDGAGLYLKVSKAGGASWLCRYWIGGKMREAGLGGAAAVSLDAARKKAAALKAGAATGADPLAQRDAAKAERAQAAKATGRTFNKAAAEYIAAHSPGWKSDVHRNQWASTLRSYAAPVIGDKPVAEISTDDVLAILQPIWTAKPETANRVRGRVEMVLDFAKARGWREGENPARWRGHLALMLPAKAKLAPVQHHAALAWQDVPELAARLRESDSMSAAAALFILLTGARSMEARGMRWSEVAGDTWTLPAARSKNGLPWRVPLSSGAQAVLRRMLPHKTGPDSLVFPGFGKDRDGNATPLSDVAISKLMPSGATVHGLRSTLRDWCADEGVSHDVAELCLNHTVGSSVSRAYRRTDLLEQRRDVMQRWCDFVNGANT